MEASRFLALPTEIRLHIYDFALQFDALTISAEPIRDAFFRSSYGPIRGLLPDYRPVAREGRCKDILTRGAQLTFSHESRWFDLGLEFYDAPGIIPVTGVDAGSLRASRPNIPSATIPVDASEFDGSEFLPDTFLNLHLTCRAIHNELLSIRGIQSRTLALHLTFPFGLCAVVQHYPHLFSRASSIELCGSFDMEKACGARMSNLQVLKPVSLPLTLMSERNDILQAVVDFFLGPNPIVAAPNHHQTWTTLVRSSPRCSVNRDCTQPIAPALNLHSPLTSFTCRIYYPNDAMVDYSYLPSDEQYNVYARVPAPLEAMRRLDLPTTIQRESTTYQEIWSNELAPTTTVMSEISVGKISLSVARGVHGTGIEITAVGNQSNIREVLGLWPKMPADRDDVTWVVEDAWFGLRHRPRRPRRGGGVLL